MTTLTDGRRTNASTAESPTPQPPPGPGPDLDRADGDSSVPNRLLGASGISLARGAVIALLIVVLGAAAGSVFDERVWSLIALPVLPALALLALLARPFAIRVVVAVAAIVGAVVVAVLIDGGDSGDVVAAFTSGPQRLLSTDWPSPIRADLVGSIVAGLATIGALSAELAARRRWHLLPLLPIIAGYVVLVGLSAPAGVSYTALIALGLGCSAFATLHHEGTLADRLLLLRGERRLVPLVVIAMALTAVVAVPLQLDDRADPRQNDPAERTAPLVDPIESTLALQDLDPPLALHSIVSTSDAELPARWRTAALDRYDGQRWSPTLTLRPIGRTLGDATGPVLAADVEFLDDDLSLVPLPGAPVAVDASVDTDTDRTIVRLSERPQPGTVVALVANTPPDRDDAIERGVASREVDDEVSGLTELATALGGDGSLFEQLTQIEATMRDEFVLDSGVQGGGLQRFLIDRFLRDTQRGNAEQFATAYVLLARSLGADARVATGFVAPSPDVGVLELASADAAVWPEIGLVGGGWLAIDPVPTDDVSDIAPPEEEPQVQAPAAPQPPVDPPPEPSENPDESASSGDAAADDGTLSAALRLAVGVVLVGGVLLLPLAAVVGLLLLVKYLRRRRRIGAPAASERIRGSWATATDALVDAGLDIPTSWTDGDIARAGRPLVSTGQRELHRLANLSAAATYGRPAHIDALAREATDCLGTVEHRMSVERTRWQRWRWRLSIRSLRSATRSPVR